MTVTNPGSAAKLSPLEVWREGKAREWDKLGGWTSPKPDNLHLESRRIAEGYRAGQFDPLPL